MKKFFLPLVAILLIVSCKTNPTGESKEGEDLAIESVEGDKVLLRLQPKVGDKQDMLAQVKMVMNGGQQNMDMDMDMKMNMEVTAVKDSVASYKGQIGSVKMDMDMGGMKMNFDSEDADSDSNPMGQAFKPLMEEPFTLDITNMGKVTNVVMPKMKGSPAGNSMDFSGMAVSLPKQAVGVGDSWETTQVLPQANTEFTYTLTVTKITADEVYLDIDADMSQLPQDQGVSFKGFTGNYVLDRKTSFTKNGEISFEMEVPNQGTMKMTSLFKSL